MFAASLSESYLGRKGRLASGHHVTAKATALPTLRHSSLFDKCWDGLIGRLSGALSIWGIRAQGPLPAPATATAAATATATATASSSDIGSHRVLRQGIQSPASLASLSRSQTKPYRTAPQVSICSNVSHLNRHSPRPRSTFDFACSGPCPSPIIHLSIVALGIGFATSYWWRPCQRTDNDSPEAPPGASTGASLSVVSLSTTPEGLAMYAQTRADSAHPSTRGFSSLQFTSSL